MRRRTWVPLVVALFLSGAGACNRQAEPGEPPRRPGVAAYNKPSLDRTDPGPRATPVVAGDEKGAAPKKGEPAPGEDDEPWPEIIDEPAAEPKPFDPKVREAWMAAGATVGWRTKYQHFDYKPDFKSYPELLPSLWFRTFKPGVIPRLPAPDVPFHIYLHGSGITDAGVRELAALKKLRHLELSANYTLTGAGFAELARLPDLRVLRL